jgi:hypothetical protein
MLFVNLIIKKVASTQKDTQEYHTFEKFLPIMLDDFLSFISKIVHKIDPFFSCFESVLCEVGPELTEDVAR